MKRYYQISYHGELLMQIYASSARQAKLSAQRTYQREGRRGMNLAHLQAS